MNGYDWLESPGGKIYAVVSGGVVERIVLGEREWKEFADAHECRRSKTACHQVIEQMREYFAGRRQRFTVKMRADGTEFYKQVWTAVGEIPYGQVRSYGEIAAQVGRPKAYRAVGLANNQNPLPILIPCHRVIGKDGKLVGYKEFGVAFKEYLLRLELGE